MKPIINFEDFMKLDIRTATIIAVEEIAGADKLYKLTLDVGELGERTVAAGIKAWYSAEELVGKQVVYLANLEPRLLRGVESQGMILAADDGAAAILLTPETAVVNGALVR